MSHSAWEDLGDWKYAHWTDSFAEAMRYAEHAMMAGATGDLVPIMARGFRAMYHKGRDDMRSDWYGDD